MKKNAFFTLIFLLQPVSLQSYLRNFCNYGTIPLKVKVHYAACPDSPEYTINPLTKQNRECFTFDSGGCCMTSVDVSGEGYPSKNFKLDNFGLVSDIHWFHSTGLDMSCEASIFTFWNDIKNKIISSVGSAPTDYVAQTTKPLINKQIADLSKRGL